MYKVVIIDDEPIIVEGISKVVPWMDFGCVVAGTACSGLEGLQVIRKQRPDIIFTDISMPGMDGLSMIAALRVGFPDMMISILTGYRDFDYAQRAIQLGVNRFLLKPSNMKEIHEALTFMVDALKRRTEAVESISLVRTEVSGTETGVQPGITDTGVEEQADSGAETPEHTAGSFIVKNALKYLEANYKQKVTLADVADQTYVSQWHLSKLLNGHTGKSFSELLNHIRIEEAKKLLQDPSMRIGTISEEVGFMDVAHFSKVFKKQEGVSANEYRNCRI